jgi:hypothetical protein
MRTIDEEAAFILSDAGASDQLRRLATAIVDHECDCSDAHDDCIDDGVYNAVCRERNAANTRAEGLQRDLEADKRQSAAMRQMLEEASDLLSKSRHSGAIEWRSKYLVWQASQRG